MAARERKIKFIAVCVYFYFIELGSVSRATEGVPEINIKLWVLLPVNIFAICIIFSCLDFYIRANRRLRGKTLALISHKMFSGPESVRQALQRILSIERYTIRVEMFDWFMLVPFVSTRTELLNYCLSDQRRGSLKLKSRMAKVVVSTQDRLPTKALRSKSRSLELLAVHRLWA